MTIGDPIYGKYDLEEPVLVELIRSKPVQRLKGIAQMGIPPRFYNLKTPISRFDHSIGVLILLRKLNAPLEEQIAGLLHDISHTAFSHVFDWVIGSNKKEDHQDENHKNSIFRTEIPWILKKYGFKADEISDLKQFGLLERDIPNICVDRLDYALRDPAFLSRKTARYVVKRLRNLKGRVIFADLKSASLFARNFSKCQREHWGGYEAVNRYNLLSFVLRRALDIKILKIGDFYRDDNFVINKLIKSEDGKILDILQLLSRNKLPRQLSRSAKIIRKKFRYVDPEFIVRGEIRRLSSASEDFKNFLRRQKIINRKGIKVISPLLLNN